MNAALSDYERELDRIQNSFAIVRYCLNEQILSDRRLLRFFKEQDDAYMRRFTSVAKKVLDTPAQEEQIVQMARGNLARRHGPQERELYRKVLIHDWLGRSELLLLVAAFEHWLKDYYGRLVSAEPRRTFSKSRIEVTLAEVFGGDSFPALPKSAFFRRRLSAEVERFDHTKTGLFDS
jgi:hypothetical protein